MAAYFFLRDTQICVCYQSSFMHNAYHSCVTLHCQTDNHVTSWYNKTYNDWLPWSSITPPTTAMT